MEPFIPRDDRALHDLYKGSLPEWPSEIAFNDRKRFYLVKESELRDTHWISLYLQLVVCADNRWISENDLSQLKILKVAIETIEDVEPPNERLNAKRAVVYITYNDLAKDQTAEPFERKAIVRRVINERTGYLYLKGELWSGEKALHSRMHSMTLESGQGKSFE